MSLFDNARKYVHRTLTYFPVTTSLSTCAALTTFCADKNWFKMSPQCLGLNFGLLFPSLSNDQPPRGLYFEPWRLCSNFFYVPPHETPVVLRLMFLLYTIENSKEFARKEFQLRRKSNLLWVLTLAGISSNLVSLCLPNDEPIFLGETALEAAFVYNLMPKARYCQSF